MRNVNVSTNSDVRPLLMNFTRETVVNQLGADHYSVMYDSKNQITMYLGGGSSNNNSSESRRGYRMTNIYDHGEHHDKNDAAYVGDD